MPALPQRITHVLFYCIVVLLLTTCGCTSVEGKKTNHWAVIVSSSRFWFNYRHTSNALTMYHILRQHGIDDDHIILFLPDSFACSPTNLYPGSIVYESAEDAEDAQRKNLYGCSTQVDYAGDDVDVKRFLSVLQGRYDGSTPPTRRLRSDEDSNILIYVAGHGARSYFKFQDSEFVGSSDIAETFSLMHAQRLHKILFLADTCHAIALCESIEAPNVACLASSMAEEESYSQGTDYKMGVALSSEWMNEALFLLDGTDCASETAGTNIPEVVLSTGRANAERRSMLHLSWFDFNYHPLRARSGTKSTPAHRDAVNNPRALHEWKVSEFICGEKAEGAPIKVQDGLL
ncbi:phosphatidylinositol glycan, class K [Strigomonas culicis]|uniref:Phosphatidylinositol glycan, class K n=1 Tax=Strigomonas culicis TaxID=28005 RepID=S9UWT6_9TRYP|nr:phosphatidylinositol glycan, class K [Strigomonas culicis]|eukprot:EPY18976.1 phosphatidylinositol glycan, class K [Strigomonas culicis]